MRLRISNLCWDDAPVFYGLVKSHGVACVELAPTKIWPVLENVTEKDGRDFLGNPALQDLKPVAFQALLFGCPQLQLFQAPDECLARLEVVMRIAKWLGVRILVFGSPKNRLVTPEIAANVLPVLNRAGDLAERHGCLFCLEPNPPLYGGNWATGLPDTLAVVRELNHPAVRLHADTGAMLANGEIATQLANALDQLVSCHISLPGLRPLTLANPEERDFFRKVARVLSEAPRLDSVGLEMTRAESFAALEENIELFTSLIP